MSDIIKKAMNDSICITSSYKYSLEKLGKSTRSIEYRRLNIKPKLQNDYGEDNDCTITSIANVLEYYLKDSVAFESIYMETEKFAKDCFIYRNAYGTLILFLRFILTKMNILYNLALNVRSVKLLSKGDFEIIKEIINGDNPAIISVKCANNGYYKNHSMVVKGYIEYGNDKGDTVRLLAVNDNWSKESRFIDYDTVSKISALDFFTI